MYARRVSMDLKPHGQEAFAQCMENDVLPLLRQHAGFRDHIAFVGGNGTKAFAVSLWDRREDAEAYARETYPETVKILSKVVEGPPRVRSYAVATSTMHKLTAEVAS